MGVSVAVLCLIVVSSVFAQDEVIKVDTALVNLDVVVKDRQGQRVRGLAKEDFEVYEDGARQEITHFVAEERSLRLVLLFDVSISMGAVLPIIKQEAIALVSNLRPDDSINIVSFASEVQKPSGWLNRERATEVIRNINPEQHLQPVPASIGKMVVRSSNGPQERT